MYAKRLRETLPSVRGAIAEAAAVAGRNPRSVRLVAVTKGHPLDAVRVAVDAGLVDLGENRVGELEEKVALAGRDGIVWHMIGHVQTRKAPRVLRVADLVHAVDSLRLARRMGGAAVRLGMEEVRVLLQVNTSGEANKGGFTGDGVLDALTEVVDVPLLNAEGLMTMAPFEAGEAELRACFGRLRELGAELRRRRPEVGVELSMGMTNDLRIAVEEGSTIVRIGTALFGERGGGLT